MQYTPPHSPPNHDHPMTVGFEMLPPHEIHSKTLDGHNGGGKIDHITAEALFAKRPISPPLSSGETSESDSQQHTKHPHVSLLSALLHSPESQHLNPNPFNSHATAHSHSSQSASHSRPSSSSQGQGGYLSPHSSVPSTAMSSPNIKPGQPGQMVPAMSILRRDSISSDGEAFAMAQSISQNQNQNQTLGVRTEVSLGLVTSHG